MSDGWSVYEAKRKQKIEAERRAADPVLFNAAEIDGAAALVWCDTEADVEAAENAGVAAPVALLGGLGERRDVDPLRQHWEALERVIKHVLAVSDPALREELARRLGRHKCWTIERAPETDEPLTPADVDAAKPWPIEGLHRIEAGTLMALRRRPAPSVMTTGTRASDAILRLPADGRLIVVLGFPGAGKTSLTRFLAVHTATEHARRWAIFSPESQPWEQFAASCAEVFVGKPFYPRRDSGWQTMDDAEIGMAEEWLADRMTMVVCDAEGQAPTMDWLLERAAAAVLRDGATDFLIDPVNEVAQDGKDDRETVYYGRFLQRWKAFGLRYGCNIWVVVHPSKPVALKPGEKRSAPGPYDAAASAHFANKADLGLTVHAPDPALNRVELHVWKSRSGLWAKRGTVAELVFEPMTGRYTSPTDPAADRASVPMDRWWSEA